MLFLQYTTDILPKVYMNHKVDHHPGLLIHDPT